MCILTVVLRVCVRLLRADAFEGGGVGAVLEVAFADLGNGVGAGLALAGVVAAGGVLLGREDPVDLGGAVLAAAE